jgi:hypothetical protein
MNMKALNRPHIRAKIFGGLLIAIAVVLLAWGIIIGEMELFMTLALGAFFLGVFAIVLVTQKVVPRELDQAIQQGQMENHHNLMESLNVTGKGIYVPVRSAKGRIKDVRVFIPLKKKGKVKIPPLDDEEVFKTGVNDTEIGISFVPPGKSLLERFEVELGVLFVDVAPEELEQYLRSHITTAGLVRDINIKVESDRARVMITQGDHLQLCETAHDRFKGLCSTVGCPVCSSILCALCLSTGMRVKIESEKWDGKRSQVTYQLAFEGEED